MKLKDNTKVCQDTLYGPVIFPKNKIVHQDSYSTNHYYFIIIGRRGGVTKYLFLIDLERFSFVFYERLLHFTRVDIYLTDP